MNNILWQLVSEQADYIDRLESLIDTLRSDISDIEDLLDGVAVKLEAAGL